MSVDWGKVLSTGLDIAGSLLGGAHQGGGGPAQPALAVGSDPAAMASNAGYAPNIGPQFGPSPWAAQAAPAWGGGMPSFMQGPQQQAPMMGNMPNWPFQTPQPQPQAGPMQANYSGLPFRGMY